MVAPTYAAEKQIAIAAVRRACVLTASVFNKLVKQETQTKEDSSPVTGTSLLKGYSREDMNIARSGRLFGAGCRQHDPQPYIPR